jgi:hypothetical protein
VLRPRPLVILTDFERGPAFHLIETRSLRRAENQITNRRTKKSDALFVCTLWRVNPIVLQVDEVACTSSAEFTHTALQQQPGRA